MKEDCKVSIEQLCKLFGKSRHAYYDKSWHHQKESLKESIVLDQVKEIRKKMPKLGTPKLHYLLNNKQIKIGRDKLNKLLSSNHMLVRRRKKSVRTTNSRHWFKKYPNLIRSIVPIKSNQLWVSDITYVSTQTGHSFLSLITDAYSHKIVGYYLSMDLSHQGCLKALKMALGKRPNILESLIHHSDRGVQYCCSQYVELLRKNSIQISMTENSDPYENSIAERVNGILKSELGIDRRFKDHSHALKIVEQQIKIYNNLRPHASCDYHTPREAHSMTGVLKKRWKSKARAAPEILSQP